MIPAVLGSAGRLLEQLPPLMVVVEVERGEDEGELLTVNGVAGNPPEKGGTNAEEDGKGIEGVEGEGEGMSMAGTEAGRFFSGFLRLPTLSVEACGCSLARKGCCCCGGGGGCCCCCCCCCCGCCCMPEGEGRPLRGISPEEEEMCAG
jgi:hypothetical protein